MDPEIIGLFLSWNYVKGMTKVQWVDNIVHLIIMSTTFVIKVRMSEYIIARIILNTIINNENTNVNNNNSKCSENKLNAHCNILQFKQVVGEEP